MSPHGLATLPHETSEIHSLLAPQIKKRNRLSEISLDFFHIFKYKYIIFVGRTEKQQKS